MSSPNYPTSDIEDAFSSNSPNYTLASSDYSPASPGNTSSDSLNNSYALVPISSPTLSLFHDDPYMKVMHAYNTIMPPQVPIPSSIIVPPSPMLSPIFNPQEFFVPEELLPHKEQMDNSSNVDDGVMAGETLQSSFANKIRNVDGKILGKDGKSMRKAIRFVKPVRVLEQPPIVYAEVPSTSSNPTNGDSFASVLQHKNVKKVVNEVSARFDNTLYGYFVGKKLAFPLVENYVKNTWMKYGLERVMNKNGFFFFQFTTHEGMEKVIENGHWLIRSVPLILNVWTPNAQVKKDEIKNVLIWVKLCHVPVVAYSEIRLSLITTQPGRPIMLDSYTCNMCINSWGKSDYARALIQVTAEVELATSVVVAIPFLDGMGHSLETVDVEYEWTPPRRVDHGETSKVNVENDVQPVCPKQPKEKEVVMKNSFEVLMEEHTKEVDQVIELEQNTNLVGNNVTKGASTPIDIVSDV
nr:hypothetical protein [Tanacetum cinerariifolium]